MAGALGLGLPGGHVGSPGMAGAVGSGLPLAMLVSRAWRDLWAWVCQAAMVFPGHGKSCRRGAAGRPCWFPGHGGSCWSGAAERPCWFPGHGGSCWAVAGERPCWFPGHGGSRGPGAANGHVCFQRMVGVFGPGCRAAMLVPRARVCCGPGAARRPCWFPWAWQELWDWGGHAAKLFRRAWRAF